MRRTACNLDVAALSVWVELARSHIFDHMLTQRTDGVSSLMGSSFLSEVDDTSILRTGALHCITISQLLTGLFALAPAQAGWSAATLCCGTFRACRGRPTMSAPEVNDVRGPDTSFLTPGGEKSNARRRRRKFFLTIARRGGSMLS